MAEKEYHRLARSRARTRFAVVSAGASSIWLGRDHVLSIDSSGYTEKYKRFYYRDIQALIIQRTERHKWMSLAFSVLAAVFLFPALLSHMVVLKYVLGIAGALFVFFLLVNVALGPCCDCWLRTAVQIEELPSLSRLRRAREVLNRLRPFIVAAQGELQIEEIPSRLQGTLVQQSSGALTPGTEGVGPDSMHSNAPSQT